MSIFNIVRTFDMLDLNKDYNMTNYDFGNTMNYQPVSLNSSFYARTNKTDEGYSIVVEMPGLSRSDISIETKGSTLTIEATREENKDFYPTKQHFKR